MLQASPAFLLAVIIAVYGCVQPYKDTLTNILEIFVQVDFLILVFLWATPHISEEFFVFKPPSNSTSSHGECAGDTKGVAEIVWILMPIFYLPLVTLLILLITTAVKVLTYHIR